MQSVRAPYMCMRQNSWCTGPAWLGLQEKCTETATPQSSQRHHLASREASTASSQRTSGSDAARWEAYRWHHHSPLVERQAISLGRYGDRYVRRRSRGEARSAANHAATNKNTKYSQLSNTHCVRSGGHWDKGYMAPSGGGTGTEDWKTDGQHYRRCHGVHLTVPAAVRRTTEGGISLISKHVHRQLAHLQ